MEKNTSYGTIAPLMSPCIIIISARVTTAAGYDFHSPGFTKRLKVGVPPVVEQQ